MSSTGARRAWNTLLVVVYVLATGAAMALAALLAADRPARIDVTITGALDLSPRTRGILAGLEGEYEIVAAFDHAGVPRAVGDRVDDVLEEFDRRSDRVRLTRIDVSTAAGGEQLRALGDRLRERDAGKITTQTALLSESIAELEGAETELEALGARLLEVRNAIGPESVGAQTNRAFFEQQAGVAHFAARELREKAPQLRAMLESPAGAAGVADTKAVAEAVAASLDALVQQHDALGGQLRTYADAEAMPRVARDRARPLVRPMQERRDRWAVLADGLSRLERPDVVRVAGALERSQALLVVGPEDKGVTAIDLGQILPTSVAAFESVGVSAAGEMARRTEERVATAIGSLASPVRPIVVVTHAEPGAGLVHSGALGAALERLAMRGIDIAEWAVAVDPDPPELFELDPAGVRPIVWLVVNTNSAVASREGDELGGAKRAEALGDAIEQMVAGGESVLLSLNPSVFPGFGEEDPTARALAAFGIGARSGRPLLRRVMQGRAAAVTPEVAVLARGGASPVGGAIENLTVRLPWAIPLELSGDARAVLALDGSEAVWGESQWLRLWQTDPELRRYMSEAPARDEAQDMIADTYVVAAAGSREHGETGRTQRLVVVGSNGWLLSGVAQDPQQVDGRVYQPGNFELLEASVFWLSGMDALVAKSAATTQVALIKPMEAGRVRAIAWSLIAGLPLVILTLGAVWRLTRG